jgi:hypothetical protein
LPALGPVKPPAAPRRPCPPPGVIRQVSEGPRLRVSPELADPLGAVKLRETEDVMGYQADLGADKDGEPTRSP